MNIINYHISNIYVYIYIFVYIYIYIQVFSGTRSCGRQALNQLRTRYRALPPEVLPLLQKALVMDWWIQQPQLVHVGRWQGVPLLKALQIQLPRLCSLPLETQVGYPALDQGDHMGPHGTIGHFHPDPRLNFLAAPPWGSAMGVPVMGPAHDAQVCQDLSRWVRFQKVVRIFHDVLWCSYIILFILICNIYIIYYIIYYILYIYLLYSIYLFRGISPIIWLVSHSTAGGSRRSQDRRRHRGRSWEGGRSQGERSTGGQHRPGDKKWWFYVV